MSRSTVHTSDTEKKLLAQPRCRDQFSPNTSFKLLLLSSSGRPSSSSQTPPNTVPNSVVSVCKTGWFRPAQMYRQLSAATLSSVSKPCSKNSPTLENTKNLCKDLFSGQQFCTAIPYNCWGDSAVIVLRNLLSLLN